MPQLGETVTEGTVTRWLKSIGDDVAVDEPLLEVSTDKVDTEIPSAVSGVLREILIPEGETVPIGTLLAHIGDDGPRADEHGADRPVERHDPSAEAPPARPDPSGPPTAAIQPPTVEVPAAPSKDRPPGRPERRSGSEAFLSPVVRRLLEEHQLDPADIPATGAGGRLTAADIRAHVRSGGEAQSPVTPDEPPASTADAAIPGPSGPSPAPASSPAAAADLPTAGADDEVVPFSSIRRRTASHMVRSLATSAHTLVAVEVDYHGVELARTAHQDAFRAREGVGLSYLPFIARATVDAIGEFPWINASVGDGELIIHGRVNLGVAVDLDFEGLIVPVVHDAHRLRLAALTRTMADQAAKARDGSLTPDDVTGGTFTITNAGGYGTLLTTPIIAQPQVAILSTDGVAMRPAAIRQPGGSWGLGVRPLGNLALSFDHRAFDGAYAAAFMARVREMLQDRDWSVEVGT